LQPLGAIFLVEVEVETGRVLLRGNGVPEVLGLLLPGTDVGLVGVVARNFVDLLADHGFVLERYIGKLGPVEELLDVGVEDALAVLPLADAFGQLLAKLVGLAGVGVLVDKSIQVGPYEVRLEKREVIVVEGFLWGVDEAAFVDELLLPMSGWVSPFSHVA
jgi:hypothetical protein